MCPLLGLRHCLHLIQQQFCLKVFINSCFGLLILSIPSIDRQLWLKISTLFLYVTKYLEVPGRFSDTVELIQNSSKHPEQVWETRKRFKNKNMTKSEKVIPHLTHNVSVRHESWMFWSGVLINVADNFLISVDAGIVTEMSRQDFNDRLCFSSPHHCNLKA